jgi:predicted nucleic acid-binding protein
MEGATQFLDTNIFLRHLAGDDPVRSPRATKYFQELEDGKRRARITDTVIFEVVFTLQKTHHSSKATIQQILLPLIELPGIILPRKRRYRAVFDLYVNKNLPFVDAYYAVEMKGLALTEIVSFDPDFDRVPGIVRLEPT